MTGEELMREYATCYGVMDDEGFINVEAVREWVRNYVDNGQEPTKQERYRAIMGYISAMVKASVTERIRARIELERKEAA